MDLKAAERRFFIWKLELWWVAFDSPQFYPIGASFRLGKSEFGYDYNNESKKIHNKCVSHLNELLRITSNSDVYSISNELNEMIN